VKLLARVHAALEEEGIPHALIRAAALAAHGVARSTIDLDLLVTERACLEERTWRRLRDERVSVEIRVGDADDPLAGVVRFRRGRARPVDVVVGRAGWQQEIVARSRPVRLAGADVPVVLAADLILLKLYAGGSQDRWDIEQLLGGEGRGELITAVERTLAELPLRCRKLWNEIVTGAEPR
jgi:hypothetical protein